jgi:hypothetical protein
LTFRFNRSQVRIAVVGGGMFKFAMRSKRLWRPLIGVVVAYAVAAQSLLIVLGGFPVTAQANEGAPAFELCLHDGQAAPALPGGNPGHSSCTHCIFCFAGSHYAVVGAPPFAFHRVYIEMVEAQWAADKHPLPRLPAHSIASPRGPPLFA